MSKVPNLDYIQELAMGSKEFKNKLIDIIQREFPEEKSELIQNIDTKNLIKAAELVHKLKHKIGMLGLEGGYVLAEDFEEGLKKEDPSLWGEFAKILEKIEDFLIEI